MGLRDGDRALVRDMVLCGFGSWRWVINRLLGYPLAFPEPNAQHGTGVLHFPLQLVDTYLLNVCVIYIYNLLLE
jgi:hypothetical protein